MNIKRIELFFNPTLSKKKYFCRNCCNSFFSEIKYNDHIKFCQTNKPMILLPSKNKYSEFKNIRNTIQHNFIAFADIESYMLYKNIKIYDHDHLISGYYQDCLDKKYSKKVQLFDKLEDFRDNLIKELDYIENINENVFNYEIDMSTFNQKEFDDVKSCKYCNHNFENKFNGRQITLTEKVDKYKLKRIIDDFDNNNINEETQNNLKRQLSRDLSCSLKTFTFCVRFVVFNECSCRVLLIYSSIAVMFRVFRDSAICFSKLLSFISTAATSSDLASFCI